MTLSIKYSTKLSLGLDPPHITLKILTLIINTVCVNM